VGSEDMRAAGKARTPREARRKRGFPLRGQPVRAGALLVFACGGGKCRSGDDSRRAHAAKFQGFGDLRFIGLRLPLGRSSESGKTEEMAQLRAMRANQRRNDYWEKKTRLTTAFSCTRISLFSWENP
jgi:hypothetical protein